MFTKNIGLEHYAIIKTIPNLKERSEFLSTEDFDVFVKNIATFFTNKLSAISATFLTNSTRTDKKLKEDYNVFIKEIVSLKADVENITSSVKFIDVERVTIPIMLGMKTDLFKTVTVLKKATEIISHDLPKVLDACDIYLSKVISDENTRTATRPVAYDRSTSPYRINGELSNLLSTIMDANSLKDKKTVREILPNLSSLEKIRTLILESSEDVTLANLNKLTLACNRIAEKTDSFYEVITTSDIIISKSVINEISFVLEETAGIVTNAVTFWHILNQSAAIYKMLVERLKENIK